MVWNQFIMILSMIWNVFVKVYFSTVIAVVGVFLESTTEFTVDARNVVPRTAGKVKAFVTAPSGTRTEALVNDHNDGTYKCMYTPFEQGKFYFSDVFNANLTILFVYASSSSSSTN